MLVCCGLQVLSCYAQMASAQEESLEEALRQLLELAGQQRASVPVLLALASGFMLKKQTPKARWACPCKTSGTVILPLAAHSSSANHLFTQLTT